MIKYSNELAASNRDIIYPYFLFMSQMKRKWFVQQEAFIFNALNTYFNHFKSSIAEESR